MRKGKVYVKGILAGTIQEDTEGFLFVYEDTYMSDRNNISVSLRIPKTVKTHRSKHLFPSCSELLKLTRMIILGCCLQRLPMTQ